MPPSSPSKSPVAARPSRWPRPTSLPRRSLALRPRPPRASRGAARRRGLLRSLTGRNMIGRHSWVPSGGGVSATIGIGHFVSWDGGCLLIGHATAVTPMHAHYAIQIAFGTAPGIRFRSSDRDEWAEYGGVVIASRHPHSMDAPRVPFHAVLFVEPETREGRALAERYASDGIAALPPESLAGVERELFTAWQEQRTERAVVDAARRVVQALASGVEPSMVSD